MWCTSAGRGAARSKPVLLNVDTKLHKIRNVHGKVAFLSEVCIKKKIYFYSPFIKIKLNKHVIEIVSNV